MEKTKDTAHRRAVFNLKNSDGTNKVTEIVKQVADSPYTKITSALAIPITSLAINMSRKRQEKKQHDKIEEEIKRLEEKIDKEQVDKTKRPKSKNFSITGGGNNKKSPKSLIARALMYTADNSAFNFGDTRHATVDSLIKEFKKSGVKGLDYTINDDSSYSTPSIYYKGQVLVIYCESYSESFKRLSSFLDKYCKAFENAGYSAENVSGNNYMVELYVADGTEGVIARSFIKNNIKVNIIK